MKPCPAARRMDLTPCALPEGHTGPHRTYLSLEDTGEEEQAVRNLERIARRNAGFPEARQ